MFLEHQNYKFEAYFHDKRWVSKLAHLASLFDLLCTLSGARKGLLCALLRKILNVIFSHCGCNGTVTNKGPDIA